MALMVNLDGAAIDLSSLRDYARKEFEEALDSVKGKKVLFLDPKLSGPLAQVAQISLLKEHGVENLYHLSSDAIQSDCRRVMYLVRPQVNLMHLIAKHVKADRRRQVERSYSIFFMPRRSPLCEKALEAEGVIADVAIEDYVLDLFPFDEDVLSMGLETDFKDCFVDGDREPLYSMARSIMRLQAAFGIIPNVKGKGRAAAQVADIMQRMKREQGPDAPEPGPSEIDTLILLDRQVDMVTPLCTQLTYEGLLDEFVGISNGVIEVDPAVMGAPPTSKRQKIPLNSSDKLFREIRDLNFGAVGPLLRQKAEGMKQDYADMTKQDQSVSELKDFVKKLNSLPEMTRHTNLAQHLLGFTSKAPFLARLSIEQTMVEGRNYDAAFEYVEEQIARSAPPMSTLRLMCLLSLTSGGLPKKHFDHIRLEFLHAYGFEHLFTLDNLEKAGLLRKQETKSSWPLVKRSLRLIVEDNDDSNPGDVAFTFSGYAPISTRLVQLALKGGWRAVEETMRALPGPTFERTQITPSEGLKRGAEMPGTESGDGSGERKVVLVSYIGGVTFAEISALRWLSKQEDFPFDFIVATTKLLNGTSLLQSLVEEAL